MQQARQDPTVIKSPQRTASIRASSMPRLAVDPQVMKTIGIYLNLYSVLNKFCVIKWIKIKLTFKGSHEVYSNLSTHVKRAITVYTILFVEVAQHIM